MTPARNRDSKRREAWRISRCGIRRKIPRETTTYGQLQRNNRHEIKTQRENSTSSEYFPSLKDPQISTTDRKTRCDLYQYVHLRSSVLSFRKPIYNDADVQDFAFEHIRTGIETQTRREISGIYLYVTGPGENALVGESKQGSRSYSEYLHER